jgi:hypothetical protein
MKRVWLVKYMVPLRFKGLNYVLNEIEADLCGFCSELIPN